ncbi:DUF3108 domain-containing protein [Undibacterium piscinae]|uniref:DUF3108 domain-containing protein n=1 Tax=Undibacterium piscinae TaxID=2495591 RepID=A0A6M4A6M1_9BURK|nr:DUF3108 domain-containing protein [Undibacterium piscinae]
MTLRPLLALLKNLHINRKSLSFAAAALLLHLALLQSSVWQGWQSPVRHSRNETSVQVSLTTAPPEQEQKPQAMQAAEPPTEKIAMPAHKPAAKSMRNPAKDSELALTDSSKAVEPATTVAPAEEPSPAPANSAESIAETTAEPVQAAAPAQAAYATAVPGSVELSMSLVRSDPNRNPMYGVGTINWEASGNKYRMSIEAGIDMLITSINLYKLSSEGSIGQFGIAPELSTEARRTRAQTATHFNYTDNTISFSSSTAIVPMSNGAQDKASVLMQLAAIGNADENQFKTGTIISMQVAEDRDASLFVFEIGELEEITTKLGTIKAWHLIRAPRAGAYNSRLDIWLAPSLGWYPVQIMNTESSGIVTTQSVTKIISKMNVDK